MIIIREPLYFQERSSSQAIKDFETFYDWCKNGDAKRILNVYVKIEKDNVVSTPISRIIPSGNNKVRFQTYGKSYIEVLKEQIKQVSSEKSYVNLTYKNGTVVTISCAKNT